jgi:hypothetical protein
MRVGDVVVVALAASRDDLPLPLVDGIQVKKVTTASQSKSGNVWI